MRAFRIFRTRSSLLVVIVFTLVSMRSPAQAPLKPSPAAILKFEVASVRMAAPYTEDEIQSGLGNSPWSKFPTNRFTAHRVTLKLLISLAYAVQGNFIQDSPGWLDSQHYDIEAKVEGSQQLTYDQIKPLLQHLLEERFHLAVHHESRLVPGYALVLGNGKQPPKLETHKSGGPPYPYLLRTGLEASGITVQEFAALIAHPAGRPVVDKTGIQGSYDFKLSYDAMGDPNSTLPSIFTAVQEQLGLKLESQKVPIEILIIDHVDKIPTEN